MPLARTTSDATAPLRPLWPRALRPRALRPRALVSLATVALALLPRPTVAQAVTSTTPATPAASMPPAPPGAATRAAVLDRGGVVRWRDTGREVALFGANYTLPSASDYRAAGLLGLDRKRLVDQDLAHMVRLGWTGIRLAIWGDWESTDRAGHLVPNAHLDLFDYALAQARARGLYVLLSPIQTYEANWPDALRRPAPPGFSSVFPRARLGLDPAAIEAQRTYLRELLEHVNPYTGTKVKDEPAILFVEMVNEPVHHPDDLPRATRYIDVLADAVRATGCTKILFHNVSQDFRIAPAIRRSTVPGVSFGWYPTGLNSGRELVGEHYLRSVDDYPPMRDTTLAGLARIVYEFDSADLRTGYLYPAMVRAFRGVGAQFAAMFAYDMVGTGSRNLGWQTHYLNLTHTPRKAISTVLAAEAMERLPRWRTYGAFPANTRFGPFRLDPAANLGELVADDAFVHAGTTTSAPPRPDRLVRVAGYGSSPVVTYDGEGAYFLDRVRPGVWRLEVYPDAVPVRDPFEMPSADKVVTRLVARAHPMTVRLPDLGRAFIVQPVTGSDGVPVGAAATAPDAPNAAATTRAEGGRVTVRPGVWLLSARGPVARASLPTHVGRLRLDEYHAPPTDDGPTVVTVRSSDTRVAGAPGVFEAHVALARAAERTPDAVTLYLRPVGSWFRRYAMRAAGPDRWRAEVPADSLPAGVYEYAVSVRTGDSARTFPEDVAREPYDWDWNASARLWTTTVAPAGAPVRLLSAGGDAGRLHFTRIGDGGRAGVFRVAPAAATGEPAIRLALPAPDGRALADYTLSLDVTARTGPRLAAPPGADAALVIEGRGEAPSAVLHVTLVERDGMAWTAPVTLDTAWGARRVPLAELRPGRGVTLPQGFPGEWNYWIAPPAGRGGAGDRVRLADVERLQLSLRPTAGGGAGPAVEIGGVVVRP